VGDDGDPDDTCLLAGLDVTAVAWRDLLRLADDFAARPHAQDDCCWEPPATGPNDVTSPGYPTYGERVQRACKTLYNVGAVTPAYHWMGRPAQFMPSYGNLLQPADAIRAATAIIRGERFCDGTIGHALEEGTLQNVLTSLAAWYRSRATDDAPG
jgi:hypothetical protein